MNFQRPLCTIACCIAAFAVCTTSQARAAIKLTPVVSTGSFNGITQVYNVNLTAFSDVPGTTTDVGHYAFEVTLAKVSGSGTVSVLSAAKSSALPWHLIATPGPSTAGLKITYSGSGDEAGVNVPFNATINSTTSNSIGSFSFAVTADGQYSITTTGIATIVGGIGFVDAFTTNTVNSATAFGTTNVTTSSFSAVPEPSSLIAVAGSGVAFCLARFRKRRNKKSIAE